MRKSGTIVPKPRREPARRRSVTTAATQKEKLRLVGRVRKHDRRILPSTKTPPGRRNKGYYSTFRIRPGLTSFLCIGTRRPFRALRHELGLRRLLLGVVRGALMGTDARHPDGTFQPR